ncbi:Transcription initiation factor IIB [Oopsacas minuta]|uniref:Transcription initiation factor IIB n=1 Tax=Oopsacas minuta TaxID=111878 RepID=A0AAV7KHU4_9METZ|nr:Transcription initiation factor IIB [Oopsacas minuta]
MAQHTEWSESGSSQESWVHCAHTQANTFCEICGKGRETIIFSEDRPFALSGLAEGRMIGKNLSPDQNDFSCTDSSYTYNKLQEIKKLGRKMKVPDSVIQRSQDLYKNIRKRNYVRSSLSNTMATYISCRNSETNQLMFFDFLENLDVDRRQLSQVFFQIAKRDILYCDKKNEEEHRIAEINPRNNTKVMLERFYNQLFPNDGGLSAKQAIINDAEIFYTRMEKNMIDIGRNPRGLYGAALLLAFRLHGKSISIHDVSDKVNMSVITIRTRLAELKNTPETDQILDCYLTTPVQEYDTNSLPPCMSRTPRKNAVTPSDQLDDTDAISDISYSIHGLHDSGDEISLCSDDEDDVDTYILSSNEVADKTKVWEEMFSDYNPAVRRRYKIPFTPEKYHTIPELLSRVNSSISQSSSQESQIRSPPGRKRGSNIPLHGNRRITELFSSVSATQEIESPIHKSPIRSPSPCEYEDDDNFTPIHPHNPYMTPPDSEDDSLNFELIDNDPNFQL